MKTIGQAHVFFPETADEAAHWQPITQRRALASRVLCVAHNRIEGTWCAYCDAVAGENHQREADAVLRYGDKLSEELALLLFPFFKGIPYAN